MKEEINLLPPVLVRRRRQRLYVGGAGQLLRRLDLTLALVVVMLAVTAGMQAFIQRGLDVELQRGEDTYTDLSQEVQATNELLQAIAIRSINHRPWTPLVEEVVTALPNSLSLTSIEVDPRKQTLSISGTFRSRVDVTEYERRLKALPWVEAVEAPLKNFATGETAGFTFSLTPRALEL